LQDTLSLETDPFYSFTTPPSVEDSLLKWASWGQKTKGGFFKRWGATFCGFDLAKQRLRACRTKADEATAMLKKPAAERLQRRANAKARRVTLWAILRNSFHYAAVHWHPLPTTPSDVDLYA
jgi:3-hydroxyacyl-CoA dehydrogenase